MWGVAFGLVLITTGVVLITIGSRSLDAAASRRTALLRAAFVTSPLDPNYQTFTQSGTFGLALDEPAYTGVYLWNLTNAERVLAGTESPVVAEIGPYVYEKKTRKVNVTFHTTLPTTVEGREDATVVSADFGYVSYGVVHSYGFDAKRSNGTEADRVVTLNATYGRTLTKYRHNGYSERLLVAQYAQQHMQRYGRRLQKEFLADTKQRGLQFFLPEAVTTITRESVAPAILRQRARIDSSSLSRNLVRMYAVARTESIPQVLGDVMKDITDRFLPEILEKQLDAAKRDALPRVLGNLRSRLKVEAVPVMLQKQMETQQLRQVPVTLNSLAPKVQQLAFPYVMQELFDRACLEVVPFVLRTIKLEIIARDTATNRNQADVAQNNVIEAWRQRTDAARVDFDAWIDDNPTGQPRTGFELRPPTDDLQLSKEVATLLLGSKTSNKRFSIVDYDVQKTATYPLDVPVDTPIGFAIWKQVIALNETSIQYLMDGVNNDVAKPSDYITRDQVMFIRDYLMQWARRDVVLRDRERFWRQNFVLRTANTDFTEPAVDLDIEKAGIQTGYNLQASGASTSGVTPAIAKQLWNSKDPFSFANVQGFTQWFGSAILQLASSSQALLAGIPGLTSSQLTEVSGWIKNLLDDGFVRRRALRHWADGTCFDSFKLPRTSCLLYDLEPHITGDQSGFEMNAHGDVDIVVPQALREELWDMTKTSSFLYAVQAGDLTAGFGRWMQAVRTNDTSDIITALSLTYPAFGAPGAVGIVRWIDQWSRNDLHVLNIQNWWRRGTCWPREQLSKSPFTPTVTSALSTCTASYKETEISAHVLIAGASQSPYSTTQRVLQVEEVACDLDATTSKYTKTESSYQLTVKEYSCEAFSTELSDDHVAADFKKGFELAPLVKVADDRLRPSLAVTSAMWNPSNAFSFLHQDGYKKWVFDYVQNAPTVRTAMVSAINTQLSETCSKLNGAGVRSAIFNTTYYGMDENCGVVTADQVDTLQAWINSVMTSSWIETALLDQWRRGDFAAAMDIEPYRPNQQAGWELSTGCECSLATVQGTKYDIPRAALDLWQGDRHPASFLTTKGYALWTDVSDAIQGGDTTAVTAKKQLIVSACGLSSWDPWLDRVLLWLEAWTVNENLVRDVLSHWLHATCPTPSALPVINVVSEDPLVSTVQPSCPPASQLYQIALSDTLDDILQAASRPAFAQYFDQDVVDKTALVQPTKQVQETETIITCDTVAANQVTVSTKKRVQLKRYSSCNFLHVLAQGTTASMPILQQETHFEMNRTSESSYISMDIALAAWQNSRDTKWAFTNVPVFLSKWQRAIDRSDDLATLQTNVNDAFVAAQPTVLQDVAKYLKMWQTSTDSVEEIANAWLRSSKPFYDLDPNLDGIQGGFELFSAPGSSIALLPTLSQAKALWGASNAYSFLNAKSDLAGGLPVGFNAWREIYNGIDYSSERLVSQYPDAAVTERDMSVPHRLSDADRTTLHARMATATSLTGDQLRVVATWVMMWSENGVLRDYVLETWATGLTPRGEAGATIDLSLFVPARFELKQLPSTALLSDKMTTNLNPLVLKSLPKLTRRKLWDVTATGSLVNPESQVVWCLLVLPTVGVCPHVLDDIGMVIDTSFANFVDIVQPQVLDLETITRSSNLTALALQYFERQFGLVEEQTIGIAAWWRSLPATSSYFQALQVQRWQLATDALAQYDPLWFGFELSEVLPVTQGRISRRESVDDLVPNPIDIDPSKCKVSLDLVTLLWRQDNPSSFLHSSGSKMWLDYAEQAVPRSTAAFLKTLSDLNAVAKTVVTAAAPSGSASCTVEAIANWLLSWKSHPRTRQFVESLWLQSATSGNSPMPYYTNPTALALAWPVDNGVSLAPRASFDLRLQAKIAELMLDSSETSALTNFTTGFPIWRTLLTDCTSTHLVSFKCEAASSVDQPQRVATAATALDVLAGSFADRIQAIDGGLNVSKHDLVPAIRSVVVPWLLYWLDHELLLQFILQNAAKVDTSLQGKTNMTYGEFAAIQFTSATFSKTEYSLPVDVPNADSSYKEHLGLASERLSTTRLAFVPANKSVVSQNVTGQAGLGEFAPFCAFNAYDRVYAYDTVTTCSLQTSYSVSITEANAMLSTLMDPIEWESPDGSVQLKRAALLMDAFLAQPFPNSQDCLFALSNLVMAYDLPASAKQTACKATASGILLDLPLLSTMGLTSSLARIMDFQAFFKYVGTKCVYEPSVIGLSGRELHATDLAQPPPTSKTQNSYPVGGYIADQSVGNVLSPTNTTKPLWQTSSAAAMIPIVNTYLVPARSDPALLFSSKERVLGELVVLNGSTKATVLGSMYRLSLGHLTDGSQFITSVLAGRHDPVFPPPKVRFYWDYGQRVVELKYVKNVTRFGIPLMRYTIENWREPTTLPTGLDAFALADNDAPLNSVNVSTLFDDLPLVLSAGPATPSNGMLEQSRETAVDIDPVTGSVYHRRLSWQLTTRISAPDTTNDHWHRQVKAGWLSVAWVREQQSVSPSNAQTFVANTVKAGPFAPEKLALWGVIGGGAYVVVGLMTIVFFAKRARMVRLRKQQSVMPAGTLSDPGLAKPENNVVGSVSATTTATGAQVSKQVDNTSDVEFASSNLLTVNTSPRARKRTVSRVQTITEGHEDTPDDTQLA